MNKDTLIEILTGLDLEVIEHRHITVIYNAYDAGFEAAKATQLSRKK